MYKEPIIKLNLERIQICLLELLFSEEGLVHYINFILRPSEFCLKKNETANNKGILML